MAGGGGLAGLDKPAVGTGQNRDAGTGRPDRDVAVTTAADGSSANHVLESHDIAAGDLGPAVAADAGADRDEGRGAGLIPIVLPGPLGGRKPKTSSDRRPGDTADAPIGPGQAVDSQGNPVETGTGLTTADGSAAEDVDAWNRPAGWLLATSGDRRGEGRPVGDGAPPHSAPGGAGDGAPPTWRPGRSSDTRVIDGGTSLMLGDDPGYQPESDGVEEEDDPEADRPGGPTRFARLLSQRADSWEGTGSVAPGVVE
jgi:hypothetical protein